MVLNHVNIYNKKKIRSTQIFNESLPFPRKDQKEEFQF